MFDIAKHNFDLPQTFLEKYKDKQPIWTGLGYFTYKRTYARRIDDENRTEEWWETCKRVVEGTFSIQKNHCTKNHLPWDERKAQRTAKRMFELMWDFRFLPPGRGLWSMGTRHVLQKGSISLNNCAFISTENIDTEFAEPFCFLMDVSMLGTGCGFDTRGENKLIIKKPAILKADYIWEDIHPTNKIVEGKFSDDDSLFHIHDTREGWVTALRILLNSYFQGLPLPKFNYTKIRPAGKPIKGFGGTSSGPQPLIDMIVDIDALLNSNVDKTITSTHIVDIMNLIGKAVVAGNIRRSAELALGRQDDKDFCALKNNKEKLLSHRWASNNSIMAECGMDYSWHAKQSATNGEPGYAWLENARAYSRLKDPADWKDKRVAGFNPCQPSYATVITPNGLSTIGQINIGDKIWSGKKWTTITNKWSTGIKPVYEYITRAGSFIGTENHRILSHGEKIEVGLAENIDTAQCNMFKKNVGQELVAGDAQFIIDGLVLGDGMVHKASNNLILLCIGKDDQDYFESEIASFIGEPRPGISNYAYEISTGIASYELPKTYLRSIPDRYRFASPYQAALFLRGLYSANGSVVRDRITLKASSLVIVNQVQELLSVLDIKSYYTINKPTEVEFDNGIYECKQSYDLNITTDRNKFLTTIGFIQKYKNAKLIEAIEKVGAGKPKQNYEIVEKKYIKEEEVFDITVDDIHHTYWTGGLLVSNCSEQTLESGELCTLVETFPAKHDSLDEYLETLKIAYLYAKTVTLIPTHIEKTNAVMARNRRIGLSQSGIVRAFGKHGRRQMLQWCDKGYEFLKGLDIQYSNWLGVPRSIKMTTVKPSGSVSLLANEPPGIHYPHSEYYIRRIRVGTHSPLWRIAQKSGYRVEPAVGQEENTMVVEFPIKEENFTRAKNDVTIWEQVSNAVAYQKYWSDNAVSITVTVRPTEKDDIQYVLEYYEDSLKSISFLPLEDHGYVQAPYETITKEQYLEMTKNIKPMTFDEAESTDVAAPKFCDSSSCEI